VITPLARYLHDHLAGATYALDLLDGLKENYRGQELGDFAQHLYVEIATDKNTLHALVSRIGPASDPLKDSAAWIAEKVSRFKLSQSDENGLGLFEALEFLVLGIHGKCELWRALAEVADHHECLGGMNFTALINRAQEQERAVETRRLYAARTVFGARVSASESKKRP